MIIENLEKKNVALTITLEEVPSFWSIWNKNNHEILRGIKQKPRTYNISATLKT